MAIANVVERGAFIYVYDASGTTLCMLQSGSGPNEGLKGYTSSTVNIRRGAFIFTYDEKGRQLTMTSAQ